MTKGLFIEPLCPDPERDSNLLPEDREAAAAFGAVRRREFLSWRLVARRESGAVSIGYNAVGAPVILNPEGLYIGVSHGAGRVAVCLSDAPCAVDIESLDRNFSRIRSRYLHPDESALSDDSRFPALVWSAKETLYKLSGTSGLDLLSDLRITTLGDGWMEGRIKKGEPLRLSFRYFDDAVVVWRL